MLNQYLSDTYQYLTDTYQSLPIFNQYLDWHLLNVFYSPNIGNY